MTIWECDRQPCPQLQRATGQLRQGLTDKQVSKDIPFSISFSHSYFYLSIYLFLSIHINLSIYLSPYLCVFFSLISFILCSNWFILQRVEDKSQPEGFRCEGSYCFLFTCDKNTLLPSLRLLKATKLSIWIA